MAWIYSTAHRSSTSSLTSRIATVLQVPERDGWKTSRRPMSAITLPTGRRLRQPAKICCSCSFCICHARFAPLFT
ncbi:unnamed protein product [Symbiodinium natans]|uniref:Uncharacterized protein n=1 Tax=Symbiodinium natans TaxID=878477 RepID=A0A812P4N2_9DINO|nr:unnamed protein product [Symbiodinium natans]